MEASELQCMVCTGQPVFSDVSHLLTHVSSKGHLAHHFKLQVRSHQADAARMLVEFDNWFKANNIAQLLSDRDSAKDDRKNKRRSSGKKAVIKTTQIPSLPANPADAAASLPDYIDPRLAEPYNADNYEANTKGASSVSCSVTQSTPAIIDGNPYLQTNLDSDSVYSPGDTELASWDGQDATVSHHESYTVPLSMTPKPPRSRMNPHLSTGAPFPSVDSGTTSVDEETVDNDRPEEMTRLKGVLWPGMDLFDAATQQMRRKRNQKKDGTLLKQMETTSRLVEPTEQIFSSAGVLLREREITGNVEDDSPLKGETPIPKKGPLRGKRGMLRENDTNIPRAQHRKAKDRKRVKRDVPQSRDAEESETTLESTELSGVIYHKRTFGYAHDGEDEDLGLSMRALEERPQQGFTVFNDEQDQDMRAPRGTLTPARLVLNNPSNISHNHGHRIWSPQGKENTKPILNIRGPIDPPIWNPTSPFLKRSDHGIDGHPQCFFDENSNTGLGMADGQDQYGYRSNPLRSNPLFDPTPPITISDHHSYGEEVSLTTSGWTANSRAMSSDATISEGDKHEPTGMYWNAHVEH